MAIKNVADAVKHGGKWFISQKLNEFECKRIPGYFETEQEANSEKDRLSATQAGSAFFVKQQMTLQELRAWQRELKHHDRDSVSYFVVGLDRKVQHQGRTVTLRGDPISKMYASRFAAVKALRVAKRIHPEAYLTKSITYFDKHEARADFVRQIVK